MAGIAGSLYVHVNQYASPETFGVATSILLIVVVAIGGSGSYWDRCWGADLHRAAADPARLRRCRADAVRLGMLIVLIAFPGGLASVPDALVRVLSRLFASKRRP